MTIICGTGALVIGAGMIAMLNNLNKQGKQLDHAQRIQQIQPGDFSHYNQALPDNE